MAKNRDVLISGAGIAGPTLAYWLLQHGFTVQILEQHLIGAAGSLC